MRLVALILVLLLVGCSNMQEVVSNPQQVRIVTFKEDQMFDDTVGATAKTIRWVRLPQDELQKRCAMLTGVKHSATKEYLGCATYNTSDFCVIYTGTTTSHQVLGHEVRHCYHGDFHK